MTVRILDRAFHSSRTHPGFWTVSKTSKMAGEDDTTVQSGIANYKACINNDPVRVSCRLVRKEILLGGVT